MTKFLMVIIIVVASLVAYNYFTTGKLSLIPNATLSGEEQEIKDLADNFHTARRMVIQAQRSSGVGGIAGVNLVEPDMSEIDQIESRLGTLMDSLESESALEDAERLEREIDNFRRGI